MTTTTVTTDVITDGAVTAAKLADSARDGTAMLNGRFHARVAANTLILEVLTTNGETPSATNPVYVIFRDATATTSTHLVRTITAALSITVPDTATLGTVNAIAARLYGFLADEAGSVRIGVYNPYNPTGPTLVGLNENTYITSTLIGTGSDSAQTAYTNDAVTAVAFRTVGYCEITEATAGTWATAPTKVHTLRPGDLRTDDIVQTQFSVTGAMATGTTVIPHDDTIPQITEGDQYMTLAITPTSAINVLNIVSEVQASSSAAGYHLIQGLFQDAVSNALAVAYNTKGTAFHSSHISLYHVKQALTTSSTTFRIRAGGNNAGTTTFNGDIGVRTFGGVLSSYMKVTETFV